MNELKEANSYANYLTIENLGQEILPEAYAGSIPEDHIYYLLNRAHTASVIAENISNKTHIYFLLQRHGSSVGYLGIELKSDCLVLNQLYVLQANRGFGIGLLATDRVKAMAQEMNYKAVELTVHKENTKAINFYMKNGFVIEESLFHEFDNGHSMHGYKMKLVVN